MNIVKLIGNVGREVLTKDFDGSKKATFSLATNETYTNREKEEVRSTTWHTIVAWGPLARRCEEMLEKGKLVAIEGRLSYRQFQNKENQNVRIAEIVALKIDEVVREQEVKT